MYLWVVSCPCTFWEASVINFTVLSRPCECTDKLENSIIVPFIKDSTSPLFEKPSENAVSDGWQFWDSWYNCLKTAIGWETSVENIGCRGNMWRLLLMSFNFPRLISDSVTLYWYFWQDFDNRSKLETVF